METLKAQSLFSTELPSAGGRLTPSFFSSIFNDGMNPFDECFTNTAAAAAAAAASISESTKQKSSLSNDLTSTLIPHSVKSEPPSTFVESNLLQRRPLSPLSPPKSPADAKSKDNSPMLSATRSPSPFSYSNPFPNTPSPSASPITSPEEAQTTNNASKGSVQSKQIRRKTFSANDIPQVQGTTLSTSPAAGKARKAKGRSKSSTEVKTQSTEEESSKSNFKPINAPSRKRKSSVMEDPEEDEEEDDNDEGSPGSNKRARFLERNRVAASKCRKKKKLMNQRLEEKSRLLHQHNRYLNQVLSNLKSDVLRLKQYLLVHHSCDDEPIKRYLQREAGKVFNTRADLTLSDIKADSPTMKIEPRGSPEIKGILDDFDMKDDFDDEDMMISPHQSEFGAEFHSFQEVESAALGRYSKHSDNRYEDSDLKMFFGE